MSTIPKSTVSLGIVTASLLASLAGLAGATSQVHRSLAWHVQDADAIVFARVTSIHRNGHLSRRFEVTGERNSDRPDPSHDVWSDVVVLEVEEVLKSTSPMPGKIRVEWPDYGWDSRSLLDSWQSAPPSSDVRHVWFINEARIGAYQWDYGPLPADTLEYVRRCVRAINTRYADVPPGLPARGAWAMSFGGSVSGVAVGEDGAVVVAGSGWSGRPPRNAGLWKSEVRGDAFLARFSRDGALEWVKGFEAANRGGPHEIEIDRSGQIFVMGNCFDESMRARLPAGDTLYTCVARYSPAGVLRGLTSLSGKYQGAGFAITRATACLSAEGMYVIAGNYSGELQAAEHRIAADGDADIFVCGVDGDGTVRFLKRIESHEWEPISSVAVSASGAIVLGGVRRESSGLPEDEAHRWPNFAQLIRCTRTGDFVKRWYWADRWSVEFEDMAILPGGDIVASVGIAETAEHITVMPDSITVEERQAPLRRSYLYRWSPDGELRWKKPGGGRVVLVDDRDIVCAGGTNDFSMNHEGLPPGRGEQDVYMKRYSPRGALLWAARDGGMGGEMLSHCVLKGGRMVISGSTEGMSYIAGHVLDPEENGYRSAYIVSVPVDHGRRRNQRWERR